MGFGNQDSSFLPRPGFEPTTTEDAAESSRKCAKKEPKITGAGGGCYGLKCGAENGKEIKKRVRETAFAEAEEHTVPRAQEPNQANTRWKAMCGAPQRMAAGLSKNLEIAGGKAGERKRKGRRRKEEEKRGGRRGEPRVAYPLMSCLACLPACPPELGRSAAAAGSGWCRHHEGFGASAQLARVGVMEWNGRRGQG